MSWGPKQCVVVPIDFSDESFAALDAALDMVEDASHVHVVHVLPVLEPAEPGVIWSTVDNSSRQHHAQDALKERLADPKYAAVNLAIEFGDAGEQITRYAEKAGAELIVQPSHGRTGIKRLLIGSVAERVVRLAHCPVLILKPSA